jgi:hypothetical protein
MRTEQLLTTRSSQAREVLMEESNVQPVRCPVTVCGDIHGQFVSGPHKSRRLSSLSSRLPVSYRSSAFSCALAFCTRL